MIYLKINAIDFIFDVAYKWKKPVANLPSELWARGILCGDSPIAETQLEVTLKGGLLDSSKWMLLTMTSIGASMETAKVWLR